MSKAAELAALIGSQSSLAMPNMIINGDCRVAQRTTSTASITGNTNFVVDRWAFNPSGHGTWTLSQNSSTGLSEFETSVKMLCTTGGGSPAASDYVLMYYNIEGHDTQILKMGTSDAERFTVSFYVKSNKTGTGIVEAQTTSGGASVEYSRSFTISQANTWEKKSVTMIANTSLAQDSANKTTSTGLTLYFILDSGTNQTTGTLPTTWADQTFVNRWAGHDLAIGRNADDYMELTGLQIDVGDVAQPFKYESFKDNLARCQRYFAKSYSIGTNPAENAEIGFTYASVSLSGTDVRVPFVTYPVRMRAAATVQFDEPAYPLTGGSAGQWHYGGVDQYDTPSASIQRDNGFYCSATVAGASTNNAHWTSGEWTADAEL
jgi:hypothetical protein